MNIRLHGYHISIVKSHKFIRVTVDEVLKFDVHINKVCTKVSQTTCVIKWSFKITCLTICFSASICSQIFTYDICNFWLAVDRLNLLPSSPKISGEKKQQQCRKFIWRLLFAIFFNAMRLIIILFYVKRLKFYEIINI